MTVTKKMIKDYKRIYTKVSGVLDRCNLGWDTRMDAILDAVDSYMEDMGYTEDQITEIREKCDQL